MKTTPYSVSEYKNSDAYRDIQATALMHMFLMDEASTKFAEHTIAQNERIQYLEFQEEVLTDTCSKKDNKINKLINISDEIVSQLKEQKEAKKDLPTWVCVSDVAKEKELSSDAVRKQLSNGEFEDGKDFKKPAGKILIHQEAIGRIHRRRSLNG